MDRNRYNILSILIQDEAYINNQQREEVIMSTATKEAISLMKILPENEQNFALEFIKRLVIAWDPGFTKLTPAEKKELEETVKNTEIVNHDDVDWD